VKIGYARVSTSEQDAGHAAQVRELEAAGCGKLFEERASGKSAARPQLQGMLEFVRDGDVVVVTKLDRLARSTTDLLSIADRLRKRGTGLSVLDVPGLDTTSPSGELILAILGSIAQFERRIMLERQREGITKAKAEGKYNGRPPSIDTVEVRRLKAEGVGPAEIARKMNIGRASVYRALAT
jgi:DNA invertase Pin-like site-specific DNA recombinase